MLLSAWPLALGIGGYLFLQGAITLGTVYLFFTYTDLLRRPIEQITRPDAGPAAGRRRHRARRGALTRCAAHLTDGPRRAAARGRAVARVRRRHLRLQRAGLWCCATSRSALRPGEVLGLLGRTGSGKTTADAACCSASTTRRAGAIRLGGVDLRDARWTTCGGMSAWSRRTMQLFHASVRDNLTFFDPAIPDARIVAVLDDLGLGDWLRALPRGPRHEAGAGRRRALGRARRNCWPSPASSCTTPAWSSWTKPRRGSTPPPSG